MDWYSLPLSVRTALILCPFKDQCNRPSVEIPRRCGRLSMVSCRSVSKGRTYGWPHPKILESLDGWLFQKIGGAMHC